MNGAFIAVCLLVSALAAPPMLGQDGDSASYRMTFQGAWTRSATPDGVPGSAHFSPLIGAVHNDRTSFWRPGERASREMERVAELGIQADLRALMSRDPHVLAVLEETVPGGGRASAAIEFEAARDYPLITLATMIAPSPDWFVGVSGLSLLDGQGDWLSSLRVELFPYDAGTEEGTEFSLDNPPTVPRDTITSLRGTGKFTDRPLASLTLERLDDDDDDDDDDEEPDSDVGKGPRFVGDLAAEPDGDSAITVFWRGEWADASRGVLRIEARSRKTDWTPLATADPSDGQVRIDGLETGAPYTFRLRGAGAGGGFEYSQQVSATTGAPGDACREGRGFLCLREDRFEVQVHWKNGDRAGDHGIGRSVPVEISDESGLFWFFNPDNIELVVKVLDGRSLNESHWVFFGALTDVEYWITVRDVVAGARRTYHNAQGRICGQNDTKAFPSAAVSTVAASSGGSGSAGPAGVDLVRLGAVPFDADALALPVHGAGHCEPGPERLCLLDDRFSLEVRFVDPNELGPGVDQGQAATVLDSLTTAETGFFWFFNASNIELAAKVLDGRAINGRFWLLYGGVSDVEYTLTVTDTVTGLARDYTNQRGSICGEIDTEAF